MSPGIDILVPQMTAGDATSNHTRLIQELLQEHGCHVRIVVERRTRADRSTMPLEKWKGPMERRKGTARVAILQHSIGSEVAQRVIRQGLPVVLNYHNITPARYFQAWQPELARSVERGRQQLSQLAPLTRRGIADSEFNAAELRDLGIADVVVAPVLWQLASAGNPSSGSPNAKNPGAKKPGDGSPNAENPSASNPNAGTTVLFVGRLTPNKCQHDLIAALAVLSRFRPQARLVLVGDASPPRYLSALKSLARRLGVKDRVVFTGKVSNKELLQWYQRADVLASASEHEGFGVPLVEAMANGLPIVAYDAAAVAETVHGAGIVLGDKRPATLATALDRVLGDHQLRAGLRSASIESARRFDISRTRQQMWIALKDLVEPPG